LGKDCVTQLNFNNLKIKTTFITGNRLFSSYQGVYTFDICKVRLDYDWFKPSCLFTAVILVTKPEGGYWLLQTLDETLKLAPEHSLFHNRTTVLLSPLQHR